MPVVAAADELGICPGTLRRFLREGCPHVAGRRGRGHAALVDPAAVREWLAAGAHEQLLLTVAAALPDVLAAAAVASWQQAEGFDKHRLAGFAAASWYVGTTAVLDHLRAQCPGVPDVTHVPEQIERLRKIAR